MYHTRRYFWLFVNMIYSIWRYQLSTPFQPLHISFGSQQIIVHLYTLSDISIYIVILFYNCSNCKIENLLRREYVRTFIWSPIRLIMAMSVRRICRNRKMGEDQFNFENPFENIHCKKLQHLPFKIANLIWKTLGNGCCIVVGFVSIVERWAG